MNLSPIAICTYSRTDHLRKTIDALKQNLLAKESDLYIFSDGPKPGDEEVVRTVRDYIRTIDGFNRVDIIERKENCRVRNCRGGIKALLEAYGKCIFMEDDIVTAKGFLVFMNKALDVYSDNKDILSISGYSPPIEIPPDYSDDAYLLRRHCSWGTGLWKEKYNLIKYFSYKELKEATSDKHRIKELNEGGEDILSMMIRESYGEIDALDVKAMYLQFIRNMYSLYPRYSLVQNIGHDGSGIHCGITAKFNVSLWDSMEFKLSKHICIDDRIVKSNKEFRKLQFRGKIKSSIFRFSRNPKIYPFLKFLQ